ncbi:UNVERIFIED_CONTAM: Nucleoside diphosphate kinase B [Sesamum radiatum]|uniref:Nucleoside diphosphate kinase B n=1 Tax=Sesamum radiatum TaxID=300843 RepID=A0AAW2R159_SESRA
MRLLSTLSLTQLLQWYEKVRMWLLQVDIIGATNRAESAPRTIHGNVIHGSDAVESARKEIALWFLEGIAEWSSSLHPWIYE